MLGTLPVFHHFSQSLGAVELRGFLLASFLEIDLGFARTGDIDAAIAVPPFDAAAKLDFVGTTCSTPRSRWTAAARGGRCGTSSD